MAQRHPSRQWLRRGIYGLNEAARLAGVHPQTAKRWVVGYRWESPDGVQHESPPVFERELPDFRGEVALSFLDLVELLFVQRFREHGVPLQTIRRAADVAAEMFGQVSHPFTLRRFETDGRTVLARVRDEDGDEHLIDLVRRQAVFKEVFASLLRQLDYEHERAARWWPLGKKVPVVVDPRFSFGRPTIADVGVPTATLADTAAAWGDTERVARWYEVSEKAVRAALDFERQAA